MEHGAEVYKRDIDGCVFIFNTILSAFAALPLECVLRQERSYECLKVIFDMHPKLLSQVSFNVLQHLLYNIRYKNIKSAPAYNDMIILFLSYGNRIHKFLDSNDKVNMDQTFIVKNFDEIMLLYCLRKRNVVV